ncbi:hypothetical protein [Bordetella trematum]|nr:hypothetical protein [Bordetella trematum]
MRKAIFSCWGYLCAKRTFHGSGKLAFSQAETGHRMPLLNLVIFS